MPSEKLQPHKQSPLQSYTKYTPAAIARKGHNIHQHSFSFQLLAIPKKELQHEVKDERNTTENLQMNLEKSAYHNELEEIGLLRRQHLTAHCWLVLQRKPKKKPPLAPASAHARCGVSMRLTKRCREWRSLLQRMALASGDFPPPSLVYRCTETQHHTRQRPQPSLVSLLSPSLFLPNSEGMHTQTRHCT